ncbi:hypothetical protein LC048_20875 [Mesobacillus subterraneus]|uniref:hypothetical protein n=1 Tax=Mesobacillus subterraneus TaxID=285983 RepID=UPI001CFE26F7|nr:hypothetical protein [Mesobacillus subterraneus]WLR54822.1 hypothetical protein LC048_20875 [Mesobacillus subterraneus]
MGKRGKVTNTVQKKKGITNPVHPEGISNTLSFDFSYSNWLKCVNNKDFTNKLKDEAQFASYFFEIFQNILPTVQKNWDIIKLNQKKQFPHCHTLAKGKIETAEKVIREIHGRPLLDKDDNTLNYWQLGLTQSIRVVAVYNQERNLIFPVFVDYHHLLHESIKYNQKDYDNYGFCPVCKYSKSIVY